MNLIQKVERLLHDKYRYPRYYCSALLTLMGMIRVALTHRIDQLSHQTVVQLDDLHQMLVDSEAKLANKQKLYSEIGKELKAIHGIIRDIVRGLIDKKIIDSGGRLFAYFYSLMDPNHPVYRRLDELATGKESMASSVSTAVPHTNLKIYNEVAELFWEYEIPNQTIAFVEEVPDKLLKFLHRY